MIDLIPGLAAGVSTGGNSSGSTGTVFNQIILAGGNNITLSQSTNGQFATITISAGASGGGGSNTAGMSNLGNTSGTSGVVSGSAIRFVFAGGNNITLSQSLDAGNVSGTITISAANETLTVPPIGTAVKEVVSALSTGTITRFAPEDHAHRGINLVQITGNTSNTSNVIYGSLYFAGGNNITLSQVSGAGVATISISAANETQTVPPIATAVSEVASAGSTGTVTRFAPEDHVHRGVNLFQISGNTSNTSNVVYGSIYLAGGNNITLSQVSAAGKATITISAANETLTVPPIATAVKVAVSTLASTGSITRFSPEDHMHQGVNSAGISAGNTSGTTGVGPGRLVLAGGNNITLSQATDATGSTVSVSGGLTGPTLSLWDNHPPGANPTYGNLNSLANGLWIGPLYGGQPFPGYMTVSTLYVGISAAHTNTSATTQGNTSTFSVGFYTLNGNTLSLLNSGSSTWGFAAASDMSSNFNGRRQLSFNSSLFASSLSFTPTRYWVALHHQTSGSSFSGISIGGISYGLQAGNQFSGNIGTSVVISSTLGEVPFGNGSYSITFTTGMPTAIQSNDLDHTKNPYAGIGPSIAFNNVGTDF